MSAFSTPAGAPGANALPPDLKSLIDHERHAQGRLDAAVWAYVNGGAGNETTLRVNTVAWNSIELLPRVLRALSGGHTRVQLLGRTWPHPLLVAPMAQHGFLHPHAELATALGASALSAGLVLSTQSSMRLEDVASLVLDDPERGPLWFQLYLQADRGFTHNMVQRVERAGFEAIVLTVDAPVQGVRDRERSAGFPQISGLRAVNLAGMPRPAAARLEPGQSRLFDDLMTHAPTWDDVAWLRSVTHLPVLLKGITHPDDARLALQHDAQGLIVSNHGGRTLDTVPATARLLPRVVQAVNGEIPVLVDGGIRRGTDVLKAMALGASAVLVGRPVLHGLANAGASGVAHVIRLLRDELEVAMALCGCRTLAEAGNCLADEQPPTFDQGHLNENNSRLK